MKVKWSEAFYDSNDDYQIKEYKGVLIDFVVDVKGRPNGSPYSSVVGMILSDGQFYKVSYSQLKLVQENEDG